METKLDENDIKQVHFQLEKKFPLMLKGFQNEGLIESAIERQYTRLYGSQEQYGNVYKKAAALMEAITRWHIFNDGNKRTGLLCAFLYLYLNNHYLAIPIDAVRFTQKVAATKGTDQETIDALITEIADWLIKFTAKDPKEFSYKVLNHTLLPALKLTILNALGFKKYVKRRLYYLFATEAHPEYKQEMESIFSFLFRFMWESWMKIVESGKTHPRDLQLPNFDPMQCAISEHEISIKEENKLYDSVPDRGGVRHHDTFCIHCGARIRLETDPQAFEIYWIYEIGEK